MGTPVEMFCFLAPPFPLEAMACKKVSEQRRRSSRSGCSAPRPAFQTIQKTKDSDDTRP